MDPNLVFSGGQMSGAQTNGNCYGGILTDTTPFIFNAALLDNPCNGTSARLTLHTHDAFTGQLHTSILFLIYGGACASVLNLHDTPIPSNEYRAGQQIYSKGTVAANDIITMKAGQRITLQKGFKVETGSRYRAEIEGCN